MPSEKVDIPRELAEMEAHYLPWVQALEVELERLREAIADIDAHATPLGEDGDGFVTTGYLVSVGAMHRALGVLRGGRLAPKGGTDG